MADHLQKRIAMLQYRIEASQRRMNELIAARLAQLDKLAKLAAKVGKP